MFDINGKVALVTGGSSGIGLEYVKALLANGCKGVSILDVDEKNGNKVLNQLRAEYGAGRAIFFKVDVTEKAQLEDAFEKTIKALTNLDIVINNAGIYDEENFDKMIAINFTGVARGIKLANKYLPKYKTTGETIIVNTASIAGLLYAAAAPVYCATKHGVIALSKSFADICKENKIRIMTICPGVTDTPLYRRCMTVLDVGDVKEVNLTAAQPAAELGKTLLTVIREGKCGSVWVQDQKAPYEVEFPNII